MPGCTRPTRSVTTQAHILGLRFSHHNCYPIYELLEREKVLRDSGPVRVQ